MKTLRIAAFISLLLPNMVLAEAGYTSANFLKVGMGARAAAMADSFTAVADDPTALYWNPAGLALVKGTSLSTTHGQWLQGISSDYFALSRQFSFGGVAALGFVTQNTGNFASTLEDPLGNYAGLGPAANASDWALSLAYADCLGRFVKGDFFENTYIGLKTSLLGQNAVQLIGTAVSFEVGILQVLPKEHLALGLDIQNIGSAIQDRSQPVLFKTGVSWFRTHNFTEKDRLLLDVDAVLHADTGFHPSFGTEYSAPISDFNAALRAGFRSTDDQYGFSALTFGAGIQKDFKGFIAGLDYAFAPYGAIGATHRFTLNLSLGEEVKQVGAVLQTPAVPVPQGSNDAPAATTQAPSVLDSGLTHMNNGQLDQALKVFQEAVTKNPNDQEAARLLGTCLFKMGRMEEAGKLFEKTNQAK